MPGLAYAVVQDGAILHVAAFGTAGGAGRTMTARTPVVIGSVGKSITALAIRQLVEAGRIEADAPVTRYLPWFALAGPEGAVERVTIRSLLDHTSGLSTADGQDPRWYTPGMTPEGVVRGLAAVRADASAGTYAYSNLNYVVLGVVVGAVSGQEYGEYVRTHISSPSGWPAASRASRRPPSPIRRRATATSSGSRWPSTSRTRPAWSPPATRSRPPTTWPATSPTCQRRHPRGRDITAAARGATAGSGDGTDWQLLGADQAGAIVSQSGSTLTSNADLLVMPSRHLGVVVLMNANPTQLAVAAGAADIAFDVLRLSFGVGPTTSAPSVRSAYVVVDALCWARCPVRRPPRPARSWRRRLAATRHRRLFLGRTVAADGVSRRRPDRRAPVDRLAGSSPPGDIARGWEFLLWTLPDVAAVLLVLACGAIVVGAAKLAASRSASPLIATGERPGDQPAS